MSAPAYVLALDALPSAAQRVYSHGLAEAYAAPIADVLLNADNDGDGSRLAVDVASPQRHYGRLAAIHRRGGRFLPPERSILQAYARLAAAALDSATALEESRRQETTARTLLALSTSLAEIMTVDEVAAKLVRAVPDVVDCDRSAVFLVDPETGIAHVAAHLGYPADAEADLRRIEVPIRTPGRRRSVRIARVAHRVDDDARPRDVGRLGRRDCRSDRQQRRDDRLAVGVGHAHAGAARETIQTSRSASAASPRSRRPRCATPA